MIFFKLFFKPSIAEILHTFVSCEMTSLLCLVLTSLLCLVLMCVCINNGSLDHCGKSTKSTQIKCLTMKCMSMKSSDFTTLRKNKEIVIFEASIHVEMTICIAPQKCSEIGDSPVTQI